MDTPPRSKILLNHFHWNIQHFKEILKNKKTVYYRDASIQRFGFTYDLAQKSVLAFLAELNYPCEMHQQCFEKAAELNWFEDGTDWKGMADDYYRIKDGFTNDVAESVYSKMVEYLKNFGELYENLSKIPLKNDSIQTHEDSD